MLAGREASVPSHLPMHVAGLCDRLAEGEIADWQVTEQAKMGFCHRILPAYCQELGRTTFAGPVTRQHTCTEVTTRSEPSKSGFNVQGQHGLMCPRSQILNRRPYIPGRLRQGNCSQLPSLQPLRPPAILWQPLMRPPFGHKSALLSVQTLPAEHAPSLSTLVSPPQAHSSLHGCTP